MKLYPAIDLRGGQAVRLYQGDYDRMTVYNADPVAQAQQFIDAGAKYLHVVDLDGAKDDTTANLQTIAAIAKLGSLKIEVGGGIRDEARIQRYLDLGADRCILGTVAVKSFDFTAEMALHSIKAKPAKKPGWRNDPKQRAFQEQEEYNPFLKKCWLLIGQGQFYNADFLQASATFSYIARHYAQDEEMVAEARLWQARCYSEMEWFYEAEEIGRAHV